MVIVAAAAVEQEVAVELGARARRHARARRACVLKRDGYGPPSGTLGSGSREASAARPASSGTPSVWWRERRRCEDGGGRGGAGRGGGGDGGRGRLELAANLLGVVDEHLEEKVGGVVELGARVARALEEGDGLRALLDGPLVADGAWRVARGHSSTLGRPEARS